MVFNAGYTVSEQIRAMISVDEFLDTQPSVIDIQTYIQMARNDLSANPNDEYAKHVIKLLSGDNG